MSAKGNILLVANWESDIGYAWWLMENFWIEINKHFKQSGIDCYLIYPKMTTVPDTIASSGIIVSECDFQNHSIDSLRKLRKLIQSNNIKYLYLSDSKFYSVFYILLRFWGIKVIAIHDHTPGERTLPNPLKRILKAIVQRIPFYTADHFISVTPYIYDRHIQINRIPRKKCSVAQNGIVPIDINCADKYYTHKQFNIPADRKIIVTTGRASYYKGIDFFTKVANTLVNEQGHNQYHFLYCGSGPDMDEFKLLAHKLKVDNFFTFAGKRSDIRLILPSCHIGFHAATGEVGYSLSILEYMSAGLVSIIPDNPSTAQSTINLETGILYKPKNTQSAVDAIMLADKDKNHEKISRNAIESVKNNYNITNTNSQLINILKYVFQ